MQLLVTFSSQAARKVTASEAEPCDYWTPADFILGEPVGVYLVPLYYRLFNGAVLVLGVAVYVLAVVSANSVGESAEVQLEEAGEGHGRELFARHLPALSSPKEYLQAFNKWLGAARFSAPAPIYKPIDKHPVKGFNITLDRTKTLEFYGTEGLSFEACFTDCTIFDQITLCPYARH